MERYEDRLYAVKGIALSYSQLQEAKRLCEYVDQRTKVIFSLCWLITQVTDSDTADRYKEHLYSDDTSNISVTGNWSSFSLLSDELGVPDGEFSVMLPNGYEMEPFIDFVFDLLELEGVFKSSKALFKCVWKALQAFQKSSN